MMYNVTQSLVPILFHTILFFICIFSLKSIGVSQYILSPIRNRIWYDANVLSFHVSRLHGKRHRDPKTNFWMFWIVLMRFLVAVFDSLKTVFILKFLSKWNNLKHGNAIYCNLAISLWIDNTYLSVSNINGQ